MKKNPKKQSPDTSQKAPSRPFFARLLESQELERASGGAPMQTMKAPSDSDECFPPTTKKFPSDDDGIMTTLKFPSDFEDVR